MPSTAQCNSTVSQVAGWHGTEGQWRPAALGWPLGEVWGACGSGCKAPCLLNPAARLTEPAVCLTNAYNSQFTGAWPELPQAAGCARVPAAVWAAPLAACPPAPPPMAASGAEPRRCSHDRHPHTPTLGLKRQAGVSLPNPAPSPGHLSRARGWALRHRGSRSLAPAGQRWWSSGCRAGHQQRAGPAQAPPRQRRQQRARWVGQGRPRSGGGRGPSISFATSGGRGCRRPWPPWPPPGPPRPDGTNHRGGWGRPRHPQGRAQAGSAAARVLAPHLPPAGRVDRPAGAPPRLQALASAPRSPPASRAASRLRLSPLHGTSSAAAATARRAGTAAAAWRQHPLVGSHGPARILCRGHRGPALQTDRGDRQGQLRRRRFRTRPVHGCGAWVHGPPALLLLLLLCCSTCMLPCGAVRLQRAGSRHTVS